MSAPKHRLLLLTLLCLFSSPIFSTTYYVSTTGNNSNDGLSEMNAWLTIAHAVSQISAGDIVYVKAGNYGAENVVFSSQGTSGNPIIIQGYQSTPGDSPSLTYSPGTALDPAVMPLLSGANNAGRAFDLSAYDYIEIRNFQIEDYTSGIYANNSDNITVDNVIGVDFGTWNAGGSEYGVFISGTNNTIENTIMTDAGTSCFWLQGGNNTIQDCKAYGHMEDMDFTAFYIVVKSNGNTVSNCLVDEQNTNLNTSDIYYYYFDGNNNNVTGCTANNPSVQSEVSQGFAVLGGNNNTFTNCTANYINAAFFIRDAGANNNTFTNCTILGGNGFLLRNGAHDNNFNNCKVENCIMAIRFQETQSGTNNPCAYNNIFTNCTFQNTTGNWIDLSNQPSTSFDNNKFINCTIYN